MPGEERMKNMDLKKLFEMQKVLDEHIYEEHPELKDQDNLQWKVLALQVELGECANEWRGFKKWSQDQEPRTKVELICPTCNGTGDENWQASQEMLSEGHAGYPFEPCLDCEAMGSLGFKNPLLEEYVDCLHFILSIGLDLGYDYEESRLEKWKNGSEDITHHFRFVFWCVAELTDRKQITDWDYFYMFGSFLALGEMLGFTWEQIEQAYVDKNKINHARQQNGY